MFIFTMSSFLRPYLASKSSLKMASSNVLEQRRPMLRAKRFDGLPALRSSITGGTDDWQLMPTRASLDAPDSMASLYAMVFAEYVYRLPAAARICSRVLATPGMAFQLVPSPSRQET